MNIREKKTVSKMIRTYCRSKHQMKDTICPECRELETYAHARLERCPFGEKKPTCNRCPIHCYKPEYKDRIREVMRFAGPRMLFRYPLDAVIHLWKELR